MGQKVMVIGEAKDGVLRNVSFEAIAAGKIIDPEAEIVGLLCGDSSIETQAQEMIYHGAESVVSVVDDKLKTYTSEAYSEAVMQVIEDESPDSIVMGHTSIGKDLTPKLASKLQTGLISDATGIQNDGDDVVFTRPIYSGKAFEKKQITSGMTFVTIRPNNISPQERDESLTGNIRSKEVALPDLKTVIKDTIRKTSEGVDLSEANIVVAGGRGVKGAEGFEPLYELADALGAAVGASRGACDAEYCDYSLQIGQTGKVVTPDLYIAVGISGAIQHLAGMSNAKVIVAINKDAESNIFNVADYGLVGDLFEIVPRLTEEVKKLQD